MCEREFTGHVSFLMCSVPVISEDDAREALLEFIGQRCCYGKKAAREFVFANIDPSSAFHVRLVVEQTLYVHDVCYDIVYLLRLTM